MTPRRTFAASFVTTIALAGCGGPNKSPNRTDNPPEPGQNPPMLMQWTVSQGGDGQCHALTEGAMGSIVERTIDCPDGVGIDVGARVTETAPGSCVAVLDPCGDACDPVPAACPDPEPAEIESDDADLGGVY